MATSPDDPDPSAPPAPSPGTTGPTSGDQPSRTRRVLSRTADGLRRSWAAARSRAHDGDERQRSPSFVGATETVHIDERRHPFLLVGPAVRTAVGGVVLVSGLHFWPLLALVLLTAVWATGRFRLGLRPTAVVAAGAALAVVVLDLLLGPWWTGLLLLVWLVEDALDWYSDRLVVTDKRLYRRYGVLARHSPSISLTAIAYLDPSLPPLGRFVGYGTLNLDSAAQRDAPLSRFDFVPDVVTVGHDILELRSKAMPKFPQSPM